MAFDAALAVGVALACADARANDDVVAACATAADQGQLLRDAGRLVRARERFAACVGFQCLKVIREDGARWLEQAVSRQPSIVVVARDAEKRDIQGARLTIDDQPSISGTEGRRIDVDPGPHRLHFEAAGFAPADVSVVVHENEDGRVVDATLAPSAVTPANAEGTSTPAYTLARTVCHPSIR